MQTNTPIETEYRKSHASPNYGHVYEKTYVKGYYRDQWELIERPILQAVLSDLRAEGRTTYLDFACGTGRITSVAENIFPTVVGVDVSSTMLSRARENCRIAEFIEQDITNVPLERKFDVVTAFRFFLNAQPQLRIDALRSIEGCLDDGGYLVFNIHVNSTSILGIAYRVRNFLRRRIVAKTCSFSEINTYLEQAGFVVHGTTWYSYLPRVGWRFPRFSRWLMRPVERFSRWFPLIPRKCAQSFLIIAKKKDVRR